MTIDEAILVKGDIVVDDDNLYVKIEPKRITNEIIEDPEFVKFIMKFIKEKYGYARVSFKATEENANDVINEMGDIYKVDIYLELYKVYPRSSKSEISNDVKELLDEI